jgi:hypothetical protein
MLNQFSEFEFYVLGKRIPITGFIILNIGKLSF